MGLWEMLGVHMLEECTTPEGCLLLWLHQGSCPEVPLPGGAGENQLGPLQMPCEVAWRGWASCLERCLGLKPGQEAGGAGLPPLSCDLGRLL